MFLLPILRKLVLSILLLFFLGNIPSVSAETQWQESGLMNPNITSIETTPMGLFAGELNTNYWELPYNGIYFSPINSNGSTWQKLGLKNLGVTDIFYFEEKIYATTFYATPEKPAGLYISSDWGDSWQHIGPNLPAKSIGVTKKTILLGTFNEGLWISTNNGNDWQNIPLSIGEEYEPIYRVEDIFILDSIIFIKTYGGIGRFFSSKDNGLTWEREELWDIVGVHDFLEFADLLYVATQYLGIITSKDFKTISGLTPDLYKDDRKVLSIYKMGTNFYASTQEKESNEINIYKSANQGKIWTPTGFTEFSNKSFCRMTGQFGTTPYLFLLVPNKGIYKKHVEFIREKDPFLGNLWTGQKPNDILNRITSFFDHEYPFLGYPFFTEPKEVADKTLNFLGQEGKEPEIYYSSHNGYDFALPYGTEILAPSDGLISGLYCPSCGNTLYIDHPNGYRTVYMHLQIEGLKAQSWEKNLPISEGEVIGKVGMTGNTTGPHLHFQVYRPNYEGGIWYLMHPSRLMDPFGWRNDQKYDPFALLDWEDVTGTYSGTASKYLWKEEISLDGIKKAFAGNPLLVDLNNINLYIPSNTYNIPLAFHLAYITPPTSPEKNLKYIDNTGLSITAESGIGEKISDLKDFITIRVALTIENLQDINWDTLAIYHFNKATMAWDKLTSVFDMENLVMEAQTDEISEFAVFGETLVTEYPHTAVTYVGNKIDHWFTEYPLVEMDNGNKGEILYSLFGEFWQEYTQPFYIEQEGIVQLRYRSVGDNGLTEPLRVDWVRIDTQNKLKKTMFIYGTQITVE